MTAPLLSSWFVSGCPLLLVDHQQPIHQQRCECKQQALAVQQPDHSGHQHCGVGREHLIQGHPVGAGVCGLCIHLEPLWLSEPHLWGHPWSRDEAGLPPAALSHCFYSNALRPLKVPAPAPLDSLSGSKPCQLSSCPTIVFGSSLSTTNSSCLVRTLCTGSTPNWTWSQASMRSRSVLWRQTVSHPGEPIPQGSEVWICCWSYTKIWTWTFYFSWYRKPDDSSYKAKTKGRVTAVFNLIIRIFEE